jgi:hypothetical protein
MTEISEFWARGGGDVVIRKIPYVMRASDL